MRKTWAVRCNRVPECSPDRLTRALSPAARPRAAKCQAAKCKAAKCKAASIPPTQGFASGPGQGQAESGGLYRFVPGTGFVQVQGQADQQASQQTSQQVGGQAAQVLSGQAQAGTYGAAQAGAYGTAMGGQIGQADQAASQTSGMFGQQRPEGAQPKLDQNKFGQMYGMIDDVMNGNVDPAKIFGFLESSGGDFWKGAIVGAAAVFLVNNDAVKGAVASMFGSSAKAAAETES